MERLKEEAFREARGFSQSIGSLVLPSSYMEMTRSSPCVLSFVV